MAWSPYKDRIIAYVRRNLTSPTHLICYDRLGEYWVLRMDGTTIAVSPNGRRLYPRRQQVQEAFPSDHDAITRAKQRARDYTRRQG